MVMLIARMWRMCCHVKCAQLQQRKGQSRTLNMFAINISLDSLFTAIGPNVRTSKATHETGTSNESDDNIHM